MITLIGKDIAKVGLAFTYLGPAEECNDCKFKASCINNLEENRKYKILRVLDIEQKCPLHNEGKVVSVKVERAEIELVTNSKNVFEGSTFTFEEPDCEEYCKYYDKCHPEGLLNHDKCFVLNNNGDCDIKCEKGYDLTNITLGFVI